MVQTMAYPCSAPMQAITNDEADLLVIGPLGMNSSDFFYKNMEVFFQS